MEFSVLCKCGHENLIELDEEDLHDLEHDADFELREFCASCGNAFVVKDVPATTEPGHAETVESRAADDTNAAAEAKAAEAKVTEDTKAVDEVGQASSPEPPQPAFPTVSPERLMWRYPIRAQSAAPLPLRNCPAADSEGRIFACIQSELVALSYDGNELHVLWVYPTGGYIPGSPSLGVDGNIRIHSCDGRLHCVASATGESCWPPVVVGEPLGWAAPVTDLEANTWVCIYSGGLTKIDSAGRTDKRPFFRSPTKFDSSGFIMDGTFYCGAEVQFTYAVDLSGKRGKNLWDQEEDRGRTGWCINSAAALVGDSTILIASRDDHLYGFGLDGQTQWDMKLPGQILASPVVDRNERIYIGLSQIQLNQPQRGSLTCIDGRSQKIQWVYTAQGAVESTPVIGDDGVVYFGDNRGVLHAVTSTGQAKWTEDVGAAIRSPGTIVGEGQLLFGLDDGSLLALKCESTGLAGGWPKYLRTLDQAGVMTGRTASDM